MRRYSSLYFAVVFTCVYSAQGPSQSPTDPERIAARVLALNFKPIDDSPDDEAATHTALEGIRCGSMKELLAKLGGAKPTAHKIFKENAKGAGEEKKEPSG